MSGSNKTFADDLSDIQLDFAISFPVRFWLFLFSNILSILCSLFVLYHLLFFRNLRQSLNNHSIIVLVSLNLIYELTDISFILHYYRLDGVWEVTPRFSQFWTFIDYGLYTTKMLIFAWSTIEKHILIFHDRWLLTKKKKILLHYFPIIILFLYCLIYYSLIIFYPFCEYLNYRLTINGVFVPCVYMNLRFEQCDLIFHQIIPAFIIIISSIALWLRVLWQKIRLRRPIQWRKQRRLTIQVLSISSLYFFFQFPWTFLNLCNLVGISVDPLGIILSYAYFFSYYVVFLFPCVCCASLPEFRKKVKKLFFCQRQQRRIAPEPIRS